MSPAPGVSPSAPTAGWHSAPAGAHVSQRTRSTALRGDSPTLRDHLHPGGLALTCAPSPPHSQSVSHKSTFSESHLMEPGF